MRFFLFFALLAFFSFPVSVAAKRIDPQALQAKAEQGDVEAQFWMGDLYAKGGDGVAKDYQKSAFWYYRAAEQGDTDAQNILGDYYAKGTGVEQDYAEAMAWYRKAAELGNADAQYNLGDFYAKGLGEKQDYRLGVVKNYEAAAAWYHKSAEQGHGKAQYSLARLYVNGQGVEQSSEEACFWLALAVAALNDGEIINLRNNIAKTLTAEQLAVVKKRVADWRPHKASR